MIPAKIEQFLKGMNEPDFFDGEHLDACTGIHAFLENVRQTVEHRHYYFGHMHIDKRLFRNQTALYFDVYRLADGRKAMRRDTDGELPQEAEWGEAGDREN